MEQKSLSVFPTRTIYTFQAAGVELILGFTTPMLPNDLDLLSRPITYLSWSAYSIDKKEHEVSVYYDNSAELVVNEPKQLVVWSRPKAEGLDVMRIGSKDQPVLQKAGDDLRIDWGYLYVAAPSSEKPSMCITGHEKIRQAFGKDGRLPGTDDTRMPRAANDDWPVTACMFDLGKVGGETVSRFVMLAYDDEYSIEYLGTKLRPYWRRNGMNMEKLLQIAAKAYAGIGTRCQVFDLDLMDAKRVGGEQLPNLCALAYRQAIGGHKLVAAPDGRPMLFRKECFSNGCIGTVDVIYPAAPIFMLLNNDLLKASVTPVFDYAATPRWKFPFAPHDLGTYPKANGQVYGGGEQTEENQMPVEESGNLLIIAAVICQLDGNTTYVERYWPQLDRWAALPQGERARSGQPALHRRLRRPPGPQRQPVDQGHRGPRGLRQDVRHGRQEGPGGRVSPHGRVVRQAVDQDGRRRRPLSPGLRSAGHLEPEVQPGVGQAARA